MVKLRGGSTQPQKLPTCRKKQDATTRREQETDAINVENRALVVTKKASETENVAARVKSRGDRAVEHERSGEAPKIGFVGVGVENSPRRSSELEGDIAVEHELSGEAPELEEDGDIDGEREARQWRRLCC